MPTSRRLRAAEQLVGPRVAALGEALDCPVTDLPLLALALRMASVIDGMPDAVASAMLPNHAGPLLKALGELDARYRQRTGGRQPGAPPNRLQKLREARAAVDARRT